MALEITIKNEVKNDISEFYFTDITGQYTVNTTGGYGTPNPDRVDFAMVFYAKLIKYEGTTEIVSFNIPYVDYDATYDNTHESVFTLPYNADGWYQAYMILVPITNATPSVGDIIYSTASQELQKYNGSAFVTLEETEEEFDGLLSDDYDFGLYEDIFQLKLIQQKNCNQEKYFDCIKACGKDCDCGSIFEKYDEINAYIQSIDYTFAADQKFEAIRMLDKANDQFKCCNC